MIHNQSHDGRTVGSVILQYEISTRLVGLVHRRLSLDHLLVLAMTLLKICHFSLSNLPHSLVLLKDSLGRKSLPYFMSGMSCIFAILLYPFKAPVLSSTWSRYLLSKTCSLYHMGKNLIVNAHFIPSTLRSCSPIIFYFIFFLVLYFITNVCCS
jgi:hypothetical protein